jgi:hypothetical protein
MSIFLVLFVNEQSLTHNFLSDFQRPSFAISRAGPEVKDLQIVPARKFVKIAKDSVARGKENIYRDAGLAFGRSFRVGWGPGGALVHLGQICGPQDDVYVDLVLS